MYMENFYLAIPLAPLLGAIIAGLFGKQIGRVGAHTVTILGDTPLPAICLETPHDFYDYEAKYQADSTRYHCPCGLAPEIETELQDAAMRAFKATGAEGWGRVDLLLDAQGQPWFIEVNTVPGMTDHSLVPMAARVAGLSFEELVWEILQTSCKRGVMRPGKEQAHAV